MPDFVTRARRHARLTWEARGPEPVATPPFLILFINSICNLKCEHCFYWESLNQRDDLSFDEIAALSRELGRVENLNLSGGEPFLRREFADVCELFMTNNGTRQIYVPTNGWYTEKTIAALRRVMENSDLWFFACELSLDGTREFHDRFRGASGSFDRAMETYDALAALQAEDPRLRIHSISTATADNIDEIRAVSTSLRQPGSAFTVATPRHRRGATTTDRAAVAAGQRPHAASRPGCRSSVLGHPGGWFSTAD